MTKLKQAEAKNEAERKNLKVVVEATEVRATQTELSKRAIEGMNPKLRLRSCPTIGTSIGTRKTKANMDVTARNLSIVFPRCPKKCSRNRIKAQF